MTKGQVSSMLQALALTIGAIAILGLVGHIELSSEQLETAVQANNSTYTYQP